MKEDNQQLVNKKLTFFQRIRKNMFLRGMSREKAKKYSFLPDYLKNDPEVIDTIISYDETLIYSMPYSFQESYVQKNPNLINSIGFHNLSSLLAKHPELASACSQKNHLYNLIYNGYSQLDFIKYLPIEMQREMLSSDIRYIEPVAGEDGYTIVSRDNLPLDKFSDEAILKFAIEGDENGYNFLKSRIGKMNKSTQLKLLLLDNEYMENVSPEVLKKFIGDNPVLLEKAPRDFQISYLKEHPTMFKKLAFETQIKIYEIFNEIKTQGASGLSVFNIADFSSASEIKNELVHRNYKLENENFKIKITNIEDDVIWEIGRFDPILISANSDSKRTEKLIQVIKNHNQKFDSNSKLIQYLESTRSNGKLNSIMKLLLNDDIMKVIPLDDILDFAETNDRNKLIEIIRKTYGDKAANILIDRPQINIDYIPNTYIFNPKIIDEFGIGAVHATLSYKMTGTAELAELARDSQKMERFKKFKEITKDMFGDTAIDLDRKLRAFEESEHLMQSLNVRELTPKQKENLELAINTTLSNEKQQIPVEFPRTLEELDTYKDKLYSIYDEVILKSTDVNQIKDALSRKYFGLRYSIAYEDRGYLNEPSVLDMIRYYNVNEMINDPRVIEGGKFTEYDLDALEVLSIISEISDPKILQELSTELKKNDYVINYKHFKQLKKSVPQLYTEEIVSSLMTMEKAEEMVENATPGISIREENGVKIITLKGADFKAYISNPFLNCSGVNYGVDSLNLTDVWQNFENGVSTISGSLVDQSLYTGSRGLSLGFYSINPEQIIGMGSTDINTSHGKRELQPTTNSRKTIQYGFSEDLLDRTVTRLYGPDDPYHPDTYEYNEIASERRIQNLSEIEERTHGGKIVPDYIWAYGNGQTESAIKLAKQFGINVIFEYEPEPYKDRIYERINREQPSKKTQKRDSIFIKDIKNIAKRSDRDDSR